MNTQQKLEFKCGRHDKNGADIYYGDILRVVNKKGDMSIVTIMLIYGEHDPVEGEIIDGGFMESGRALGWYGVIPKTSKVFFPTQAYNWESDIEIIGTRWDANT